MPNLKDCTVQRYHAQLVLPVKAETAYIQQHSDEIVYWF